MYRQRRGLGRALDPSPRPSASSRPASRRRARRSSSSATPPCRPARLDSRADARCGHPRAVTTPDERDGRAAHRSVTDSGHGRRAGLDRRRDGPQARAHVLLVDHPRVRGLRLRDAATHEGAPALRVDAVDAAPVGPDPRLRARHHALLRGARRGVAARRRGHAQPAYYGASHGPDVALLRARLPRGELVGFAATTAHHLDLGALTPAPAASSTPPTRTPRACSSRRSRSTRRAGATSGSGASCATTSARPHLVVGDMEAQVAACRIGAERFLELVER